MARLGEGDPRWIVDDRPDSVNVNNWHWREKSADVWSNEFFKASVPSVEFVSGSSKMKGYFRELVSLEGDSLVCNRKGKLIVIFDWNLTVKYEVVGRDKKKREGKMTVFEITHETKDWEKNIRADIQGEDDMAVRAFVLDQGLKALVALLRRYSKDLGDYAKDLILPTKGANSDDQLSADQTKTGGATDDNTRDGDAATTTSSSSDNDCLKQHKIGGTLEIAGSPSTVSGLKHIKLTETFKCERELLFKALTDKEMAMMWTMGDCQAFDLDQFSLYGGNVVGKFRCCRQFDLIEMDWRLKDWPPSMTSFVRIELIDQSDHTELRLEQSNVPESFAENCQQGWRHSYFEPIKRILGCHSNIFE